LNFVDRNISKMHLHFALIRSISLCYRS